MRPVDAIFDVERTLHGLPVERRRLGRQKRVAPHIADPERWMRSARGRMSRHADVGQAMDYMLKRGRAFVGFLAGRICLTNNAAERALRKAVLRLRSQ